MRRRILAFCVLLTLFPGIGVSQSDEEKWIRDRAKTLAKDRDAKERAEAARWLIETLENDTPA